MSWIGYFEHDGTEVINVARTEAYAQNLGLWALRPAFRNTALGPMLGETYTSPFLDQAPWVDEDQPDSSQFLGAYPLDITGLEDSTVSAAVVQSVLDGGVVNKPRRTTRTVVFSAALVGMSECAVEYGMRWLKIALAGAPCQGEIDCTGSNLCYLACEPALPPDAETPTDCLPPLLRSLQKVTVTTGPTVTAKFNMATGVAWLVTWTAVAGDPWEFMTERPLVANFPSEPDFYVSDAYPPVGVAYPYSDTVGASTVEYGCAQPQYSPVYDPACPLVVAPPTVPNISVSCFMFPDLFVRRFLTIPKEEIPLWGTSVPVITFTTGAVETRNLRIRFYADVLETGDPSVDPCAYCGDIVFSYIPSSCQMVFDGTARLVSVQTNNMPKRRADSVVFKSNGTPFDWPELTCGFNYMMVVDLPAAEVMPTVDVSLVGKVI